MSRKVRIVCATCGHDSLSFDSMSQWNTERQRFEHVECFDHKPVCNSDQCMGEERRHSYRDAVTRQELQIVYGYKGRFSAYVPIAEAQEIERLRDAERAAERERERRAIDAERTAKANAEALAAGYDA